MTAIQALTFGHVVISLVGIASGFPAIYGFLTSKRFDGWNAVFLTTTILTSVSGFLFPADHFTPGHALGILSLIALSVAVYAWHVRHLAGRWSAAYAASAVAAQYFNVFVLIVQSFLKVPALHELAPTQTEPEFAIAQLVNLAIFIALGIFSAWGFRPEQRARATRHGMKKDAVVS